MSEMSNDPSVVKFVDYLTEYYMTADSGFPPVSRAEGPLHNMHTTHGPGSFYAHYNEQFYSHHLSILIYLEVAFQE